MTRIHLQSFLREFMTEIESRKSAKNITFRLEIPTDHLYVNVDPDHIRRVLLNLFENSHYAIPSAGEVILRARPENKSVIIEVSDTGIGLPEDNRDELFSAFITTKPGGTGLGLYLVREIIEAHKGTVSISNRDGLGTLVTIVLPLATD